jgi:uncharacterized protein YlxW (UPF0749 family)
MKNLLTIVFFAAFSFSLNAQKSDVESAKLNDTASAERSIEERLQKQEEAILSIRKENEVLKKEIKKLKSSFTDGRRKLTVSRKGSKQVIME